ncbi:hypothetical protein ACH5RR_018488 [Cinchona calisaya]|uniref:Uncharacterized protein n=1 Tax=Cinchona calisaya TaxID=153742 RepID=A0ABD2ZMH1_9GENT
MVKPYSLHPEATKGPTIEKPNVTETLYAEEAANANGAKLAANASLNGNMAAVEQPEEEVPDSNEEYTRQRYSFTCTRARSNGQVWKRLDQVLVTQEFLPSPSSNSSSAAFESCFLKSCTSTAEMELNSAT